METAARRSGGGVWEGLYRLVMRRNSIYVTFVVAGAFIGERAVDYGVHKLWEMNNVGLYWSLASFRPFGMVLYTVVQVNVYLAVIFIYVKAFQSASIFGPKKIDIEASIRQILEKRYEDIPVLGQRPAEE